MKVMFIFIVINMCNVSILCDEHIRTTTLFKSNLVHCFYIAKKRQKKNSPPYIYLIELAETAGCIAARLESCLASVMIH